MSNNINVIITAGGLSQRYGIENKLFEPCGTSSVLVEAIKPFLIFAGITKIIIAIEPSYSDELLNALSAAHLDDDSRITLTVGGATRTKTVMRALESVDENCSFVIIHDGARPFITAELISAVIEGAEECGAAVPLIPPTDSLVSVANGKVVPVDRNCFRRVQTPVCFSKQRVISAYSKCSGDFYDDVAVVQTFSEGEIKIIEGDPKNIKITVKNDLKKPLVGCGYDVHKLKEGTGIKLCGVFIPCTFSFIAHSDGDVPVHSIMDALLSAAGERDIGFHFPVDDPKYDGADSLTLLADTLKLVNAKGYKPYNITVTIIAETPRIASYVDEMRRTLGTALGIPATRVGVAATTNETVGEIGKGAAIAAYSVVSLERI